MDGGWFDGRTRREKPEVRKGRPANSGRTRKSLSGVHKGSFVRSPYTRRSDPSPLWRAVIDSAVPAERHDTLSGGSTGTLRGLLAERSAACCVELVRQAEGPRSRGKVSMLCTAWRRATWDDLKGGLVRARCGETNGRKAGWGVKRVAARVISMVDRLWTAISVAR